MDWLLAKLALPLVAPILAGLLLASVSGLGLTWWHLQSQISTLTKDKTALTGERDAARLETAQAAKAMSDFHAQVEMDRADANARALASEMALQAKITTLSSKAAQADKARRASSDALLKVLHDVPKEQQASLSPAVRAALCRVRDAQNAPASAACPAGGGADNQPIPAAPTP